MEEEQQKKPGTVETETAETAQAQTAAEQTAEEAKRAETGAADTKDEKAAEPDPKDEKIAQQEKQIAELQNRLLRLQADFDNFRKRNNEERERLGRYVTGQVAREFLKVLDNFERAEASLEASKDGDALKKGMGMIHKQFEKALQTLHIEVRSRRKASLSTPRSTKPSCRAAIRTCRMKASIWSWKKATRSVTT